MILHPRPHVHHIVRYRNDDAWPAPVWVAHPALPYAADNRDAVTGRLLSSLSGKIISTNLNDGDAI